LTLFENGDVIFAKITPCMENGKGAFVTALPTKFAFGSTEFHVLRPSHRVDGKFLYHYTYNPVFLSYAAENMSGAAGQKRVSSRFLKDARLFLPDIFEQKRIAAYLDASCAANDAAVATKRQQIEVLETVRKSIVQRVLSDGFSPNCHRKDSGIESVRMIPVHWDVKQICYACEVNLITGSRENSLHVHASRGRFVSTPAWCCAEPPVDTVNTEPVMTLINTQFGGGKARWPRKSDMS
jgi:type I restriction enzyme, S subunit